MTSTTTGWFDGVRAEDRATWGRAASLEDLGECMAAWLEGRLSSRPGYRPNCGPAPETEPLRNRLIAYNQAGLVTTSSQPGLVITGSGLAQRAAVTGCCRRPVRDALVAYAGRAGLLVRSQCPGDGQPQRSTPITRRAGAVVTCVVVPASSERATRHSSGAVLSDQARAELAAAWTVAVIDPIWGRPERLWRVVDEALAGRDCEAVSGLTTGEW